jgi:hypothetical protein
MQKSHKWHFYLHNQKYFTTFAPVISPRLGIMSFGWGGCRHNKGVITRFVLGYLESGKFNCIQDIAAF